MTMPEKKPGGLKLKLRKADTNRIKTETGRMKALPEEGAEARTRAIVPPAPEAEAPLPVPAAPPPAPAPRADQTAEIRDPMALRDTSQGKLRRIQSPDESANAVAPAAGGEEGIKRETVRLKVVRDAKKSAPSIVPPVGEGAAPEAPAPVATPGSEVASPASQTVKISLPGLKKAPGAAAPSALKHATATVRVQEPPPSDEPGKTLKVEPPEESAEFRETHTATLKIGQRKAAPPGVPAPSPGGTIKIKPGPGLAAKGAESGEQNKQMTATLKVRPAPVPAPEAAPADEPPGNKQVTATLKVRSGGTEAPDAASTVRITPPAPAPKAGEDEEGRPSLRLKRPGRPEADASATVRLPGIDEAAEAEPGPDDALPAGEEGAPLPAAAEAGPAIPPKRGLKLKPGKKAEEGEEGAEVEGAEPGEAAEAPSPEAAAQPPVLKPRPVAGGPGAVAAIGSIAACGALGALVYRLVMDFILHIQY
ncbi:MAG: hypothetical protein RBU25_03065 [Lentisphaeria bacterium]|nr:hypothetical protein [Lentisphaeria bacterium]